MGKLNENMPDLNYQKEGETWWLNKKTKEQVSDILDKEIIVQIIDEMENSWDETLIKLANTIKITWKVNPNYDEYNCTILIPIMNSWNEKLLDLFLKIKNEDIWLNIWGNLEITPLMMATYDKNKEYANKYAKMLLSRPDLDVNMINDMWQTALDAAEEFWLEEIAELIKKHPSFKDPLIPDEKK